MCYLNQAPLKTQWKPWITANFTQLTEAVGNKHFKLTLPLKEAAPLFPCHWVLIPALVSMHALRLVSWMRRLS